jgi:hypothetical protein
MISRPRPAERDINKVFQLLRVRANSALDPERVRQTDEWADKAYSAYTRSFKDEKKLMREYEDTKEAIKRRYDRLRTTRERKAAGVHLPQIGLSGEHEKEQVAPGSETSA